MNEKSERLMPAEYLIEMSHNHRSMLDDIRLNVTKEEPTGMPFELKDKQCIKNAIRVNIDERQTKFIVGLRDRQLYFQPIHCELFRGQNHEYKPLFPSIYRDTACHLKMYKCSLEAQARAVLNNVKALQFTRYELPHHPSIKWLVKNNIYFDRTAIAQHYGIPTDYLDLTHNLEVACFFATCYEEQGKWRAMDSGNGILYKLDPSRSKIFDKMYQNNQPIPQTIGSQLFPRPRLQDGWVLEVPFFHDFRYYPTCECIRFQHSSKVGEYFLKLFDYGKKLLPLDPLVNVAQQINECRVVEESLVKLVIDSYTEWKWGIRNPKAVDKKLRSMVEFVTPDQIPQFIFSENLQSMESLTNKYCAEFNFNEQPFQVISRNWEEKIEIFELLQKLSLKAPEF